jgi:superfamily II DNA or RNA helicase
MKVDRPSTTPLRLGMNPEEKRRYDQERNVFRRVYREYMRLYPAAEWPEFSRAASLSEEGRAAMAAWRASRRIATWTAAKAQAVTRLLARHRDNKVLIFTADNETAYAIARAELVMPITCDIGKTERDQTLAAFKQGELRALVSARVLNEGLDVPDADMAIIVSAAAGEREYVQRAGRLLRPAPGKRALVYELVTFGTSETRASEQRRRALGAVRARRPGRQGKRGGPADRGRALA